MYNKQNLVELAKRVDREFYKLNNSINDYEVDMDSIVDHVLDNLEIDGREVSCDYAPDSPDLDIETESLEGEIGALVMAIEELPEEAPEAVTGGFNLTPADARRITSALDVAYNDLYRLTLATGQSNPLADSLRAEMEAITALQTMVREHVESREASMP